MHFLIVFIGIFIFLFVIYFLAHDDFVLLRKDISVDKVFNLAILIILVSAFFARLTYAIINKDSHFVNPLIFLSIVKHPGVSLVGGVTGGLLILFSLLKSWKMPLFRLFDFFSIAFLCAWGIMGIFVFKHIALFLIYVPVFLFFIKFLLPRLSSGKLKEGSMGFLILISFSLISLINNLIDKNGKILHFKLIKLIPEDFILLFILIAAIIFIVKQEGILSRFKKLRGH